MATVKLWIKETEYFEHADEIHAIVRVPAAGEFVTYMHPRLHKLHTARVVAVILHARGVVEDSHDRSHIEADVFLEDCPFPFTDRDDRPDALGKIHIPVKWH